MKRKTAFESMIQRWCNAVSTLLRFVTQNMLVGVMSPILLHLHYNLWSKFQEFLDISLSKITSNIHEHSSLISKCRLASLQISHHHDCLYHYYSFNNKDPIAERITIA